MPTSARNTVKFKLDPKNPKPPSAAQRKRFAAVAAMPDVDIDYRDIPQQSGTVQSTRPGSLVQSENKQQVTLRFDADGQR